LEHYRPNACMRLHVPVRLEHVNKFKSVVNKKTTYNINKSAYSMLSYNKEKNPCKYYSIVRIVGILIINALVRQ